jgi:hypothetical protein
MDDKPHSTKENAREKSVNNFQIAAEYTLAFVANSTCDYNHEVKSSRLSTSTKIYKICHFELYSSI